MPKAIVWRTNKFGFESPTDTWTKVYRDEMVRAVHSSTLINQVMNVNLTEFSAVQLWRLFNVAKWEEIYSVKWPSDKSDKVSLELEE